MQYNRQKEILHLLKDVHAATIKEIAQTIYTSESSVRRDLAVLEQQGFIKRIYGGAVLAEYENDMIPIDLRDSSHSSVKEELARLAAREVFDGAVILMDSSSTVRKILKYLTPYHNLKIITNNLKAFEESRKLDLEMYCTGGKYNKVEEMFLGPAAEAYIERINADLLFFSCRGLSDEGEITDISEEQIRLRQVMMKHAKKTIFLCDSSKLGVKKMFTLCTKDDVDKILCDVPLPPDAPGDSPAR